MTAVVMVTVCDSCRRASCLQGEFYCEDYRSVGVTQVSVDQLHREGREHPDNWRQP